MLVGILVLNFKITLDKRNMRYYAFTVMSLLNQVVLKDGEVLFIH